MPLYLTAAHSSRVTKPRPPKRSSSLPFTSSKNVKSLKRAQTVADMIEENDTDEEEFSSQAASGKAVTVVKNVSTDVLSAFRHVRSTMFDELPTRAGMNSTRIAQVLNSQKQLPAVVSLAHIHALRTASSKTEREIQSLLTNNRVRRLRLVGRGNEISGLSELLISTDDYEAAVQAAGLPEDIVCSFRLALRSNSRAFALPRSSLPRSYADALTRAGFLVAPSIHGSQGSTKNAKSSVFAPAAIARSASGSQAAVGGEAAFETLGGVNSVRRSKSDAMDALGTDLVLSVPGLAAYLQLLDAGRTHLLDLLRQFSRHRQAPAYLLKERWNGNVDDDNNQVSIAKRVRGDFSNVLPAKTKKWRSLYGLSFDWILEECLGAGLIELFETHSVGLGVKALT